MRMCSVQIQYTYSHYSTPGMGEACFGKSVNSKYVSLCVHVCVCLSTVLVLVMVWVLVCVCGGVGGAGWGGCGWVFFCGFVLVCVCVCVCGGMVPGLTPNNAATLCT